MRFPPTVIVGCVTSVPPPAKPKRRKLFEGGNPALVNFKSRELLDELRARGYRGELKITQSVKL